MKITKRRWNEQPPLYLYREKTAGKLTEADSRGKDYTESLFHDEPSVKSAFETSLQDRLLQTVRPGKSPSRDESIVRLVTLLCGNSDLNKSCGSFKRLSSFEAEKRCRDTLSGYGRRYTAKGSKMTLEKVLVCLLTSSETERDGAMATLREIQNALQDEKKNRMSRVRTSISENKMPLSVRAGTIIPDTERAKWLLELLHVENGTCYPDLDELENICDYQKLSEEVRRAIEPNKGRPQAIAQTADTASREYRQRIWERCSVQHPEQLTSLKYYFQALSKYFKENFPIRTKSEGARQRQMLLAKPEELSRLLNPEHMQYSVRRMLISQSTQMHILYGKLLEYCCGDEALPVNSDTLQEIQVFEAVKKQVMTALSWSVARLNYFYGNEIKFDVLSNEGSAKSFRKTYLDGAKCDDQKFQTCREKLCAFFPLEKTASREDCTALMEACADCVRELRVRIFHFKSLRFTQALEDAAKATYRPNDTEDAKKAERELLKQLYQKDVRGLQEAFQTRISSMNLPLYYPAALLQTIFTKDARQFYLYSANYQMTPSFRRVYERGRNLSSNGSMRWYKQPGDETNAADTDAQRATRNLLQLLYQHFFLPEVCKNETLVTSQIAGVLKHNRELAEKSRKREAVGYGEIAAFYQKGMQLEKVMEQLQRQISQTEQENRERALDKTDYAQRFLRDVYAAAFNSYLDENYSREYAAIMAPQKSDAKIVKGSLPQLHTSLDIEPPDYLLVFYPVLRLLDGQELSELQQQMLRYRTYLKKHPDTEACETTALQLQAIEELAELVKMTEPIPENTETWQHRARVLFQPFVEGKLSEYDDFYVQSDSITPVLRRNMTRMMRTGILEIYQKILRGRKQVTRNSYAAYREGQQVIGQDPDGRNITKVEQRQRKLQRLHQLYEKSRSLSKADYESYRILANRQNDYNEAMRSLTFVSLYEISRIHMELLSRGVGFTQDWERDMYFLLQAWAKQGKTGLSIEDVDAIFGEGNIRGHMNGTLKGNSLCAFLSIYNRDAKAGQNLNFIRVRNDIEHLELLRESGWQNSYVAVGSSIIEWYMDRLRRLLSYDPKRMNSVTKTVENVLLEHGIDIAFSMEAGGKLKFKEIKSEPIWHLKDIKGRSRILIPSHDAAFGQTLMELIKYTPKEGRT